MQATAPHQGLMLQSMKPLVQTEEEVGFGLAGALQRYHVYILFQLLFSKLLIDVHEKVQFM